MDKWVPIFLFSALGAVMLSVVAVTVEGGVYKQPLYYAFWLLALGGILACGALASMAYYLVKK